MVGKKTEKIDYKVNLELQICSIILNMKNPFSVYELLVRTDSQQIKNRDFYNFARIFCAKSIKKVTIKRKDEKPIQEQQMI